MHTEEYKPIEQILKDRIGLEPAALGPKGVESAVNGRMRRLGIAALSSYTALVATAAEELEALTEALVIPETWFFRDREPFVFLADFIRSEWKALHAAEVLQILSVPCATGEEPYSIAMTCLDSGLARNRFAIEAMDINAASLRKAREAVYGRNSFRGTEAGFRARFFTARGNYHALQTEVRACVRFFKINILEPETLSGGKHYHIIFCRNLLIYLHDQARAKVLTVLDRLLMSGGLLFIGHAEANPLLMEKYETIRHRSSFAYRKPAKKQFESGRRQACLTAGPPRGPAGKDHQAAAMVFGAPPDKTRAPEAIKPVRQTTAQSAEDALKHATRLADAGKLAEAGETCAAILAADIQNAPAHFLMGLIKEARGDNRGAEECFNHAIYLDTNFTDALLHLAVLKEEGGDDAGADTLRRRAESVNKARGN